MTQQFSKSVEMITVFETVPGGGGLRPVTLYEPPGKKKKGTRGLRGIERFVRRMAESQQAGVAKYLERHERSNQKKKDGWLRDMGNNVFKAMKTSSEKMSPDDDDDDDEDDDD